MSETAKAELDCETCNHCDTSLVIPYCVHPVATRKRYFVRLGTSGETPEWCPKQREGKA